MEEDYTVTYGRYASHLSAIGVTLEKVCYDFEAYRSAAVRCDYANGLMLRAGAVPREVPAAVRKTAAAVTAATCEAERLLAAGDYTRALHAFTGLMVDTPHGTSGHARALHGRSRTLYSMGLHEECAVDLRRVLQTPRGSLSYELWRDATNSYRHVMDVMGRGEDATCADRGTGGLERMLERCRLTGAAAATTTTTTWTSRRYDGPPYVVEGARHALCPAFTEHVEFRQTADMGLGVFTARDLEPGDVVAIEDSHIGIPLEDNYYICCYSDCQKPNMVVYFCTKCTLVYYCSESCLVKDREEGGHNYECPILHAVRNLPGNKIFNQLALKWFLRESTKVGLDEYCQTVNTLSGFKLNLFTRKYIKNGEYNHFVSAFSMDIDCASTKRLFFLNCVVVEMLYYLLLSGYEIPEHYLPVVGASLVNMVQVLEKCFKLYKTIVPFYKNTYIDGQKLVDMGFSVYPSLNQINHSCDPNIMIRHLIDKRTIVLRASRPIPKGSQLFINYGKHFYHHDKEERHLYLQQNFNFKCCCQPCNENWPMYSNLPRTLELTQIINPAIFDENSYLAEFKRNFLARDCEFKICMNMRSNLFNFLKYLSLHLRRPCFLFEECHGRLLESNECRLIDNHCYELLALVNSLHGFPIVGQ